MEAENVIQLKSMRKTVGERSIYTQNLIDRMKETKPDEVVTYEELSEIIGMECRPQKEGYSYLYSAIRILQTEFGINMDNVPTVGYKHSPKDTVGEESVKRFRDMTKSVNKRIKRRLRTLAEEWDLLSDKARINATMTGTLIAFSDHVLKPRNIAKLKSPAQEGKQLGFKQTMELFEK